VSDLAALTGMSQDEISRLTVGEANNLVNTVTDTVIGLALSSPQATQAVQQRLAPTVRAVRAARGQPDGGSSGPSGGSGGGAFGGFGPPPA
jgi:hypothetical protein